MSHPPETSVCNCNPYAEIGPTEKALNCPIHGVKARAPQQVQILSQEEPEMDQARTAYLKGFSDGQLKVFETIHELSYKCKTAAEMVFRIGELHGEFARAEAQKETKPNGGTNCERT